MSPFGVSYKRNGAAFLQGGVEAINMGINNGFQQFQNNRQQHFEHDEAVLAHERQKELMDLQYDYSRKLWEANNDYNTPAAQSQRLREAGLNPYVYSHGSDIGTGTSNSPASSPSSSSPAQAHAGSSLGAVPVQSRVGDLILQGSALKNDRMRAFAQLVEAYPRILQSVDGDEKEANRIMTNLAGISGFKGGKFMDKFNAEVNKEEALADSARVQADLANKYGDKQASNMIAQSEALINESFARVRKMASDSKVNEANIEKIASEIVVNVANAWKLKKEGEKFVADAATINALRKYLVSQARSKANMMDLSSLLSGAEPDTYEEH